MGRKLGRGRGSVCAALLRVWREIHFTFISCSKREKDKRPWGESPACLRSPCGYFHAHDGNCWCVLSESSCRSDGVSAGRSPGPREGLGGGRPRERPLSKTSPAAPWHAGSCPGCTSTPCGLTSSLGQGASSRSPPLVKVFCVIPPVA